MLTTLEEKQKQAKKPHKKPNEHYFLCKVPTLAQSLL